MQKSQVYYAEVDSNGDLVENGFVMIEANYIEAVNTKASSMQGKFFKKIENFPPETEDNQVSNYLGWTQKEDETGKPISTDWEVITLTNEECLEGWIRGPRQRLLLESDWTQINDAPISTEAKAEWAIYREALRNMTNEFTEENPLTSKSQISWPLKPGETYVEPPVEEE